MPKINSKDTVTKEYLKDPTYCTDLINGVIYQGKQVLKPQDLQEVSGEEVYKDDHRIRDILQQVKIMKGKDVIYVLVGLEPQSYPDYSMVVRLMDEDVIRYKTQISNINSRYKVDDKYSRTNLYKKEKLMPIIPIVIWFEPDEWKAATRLSEMTYEVPEELKRFTNEYQYHVFQPSSYTYEELLNWFKCPIGHIMALSKAGNDGKMRLEILKNNEMYQHMPQLGARLAKAVIGVEFKEEDEEREEVDLMNGWLQDLEDKRNEGMNTGKNEGLLEAVKQYMKNTNSSKEEAMKVFGFQGTKKQMLLEKL